MSGPDVLPAAGTVPLAADDIADLREAVLRLTETATRAGWTEVAGELRAAVGPLVDAESAVRRRERAAGSVGT